MLKEYILNKTTLRTSNNYGINDIKLNLDFSNSNNTNNYEKTNDIEIITDEIDKLEIEVNKKYKGQFETKIGLPFDAFYKIKIKVKENEIINKPIYLNYTFDNSDIFVNQIEIECKENSNSKFIIKYNAIDEKVIAGNHLKQITNLNKNAKTKIAVLNLINKESDSFIAIENNIEDDATLDYTFIDLGGKNKISNYYTNLVGKNAVNTFNNLYLGNDKELLDMNYYVEIYGKKSECNIEVQGAIDDYSKKNFKGIIDFKEGSSNAIGKENENCVLLSDKAISKSLPMLLCHEENVEGAHGVASGKIDEKKLFYIMSKGISKKEAEKLIIKANFNKILNNIEDEKLKNEIIELIENKI